MNDALATSSLSDFAPTTLTHFPSVLSTLQFAVVTVTGIGHPNAIPPLL